MAFLSNNAQLEVYLFNLKVTVFFIARDFIYFFFFRKVKSLKNIIIYFIDSQVYGDNILQQF